MVKKHSPKSQLLKVPKQYLIQPAFPVQISNGEGLSLASQYLEGPDGQMLSLDLFLSYAAVRVVCSDSLTICEIF